MQLSAKSVWTGLLASSLAFWAVGVAAQALPSAPPPAANNMVTAQADPVPKAEPVPTPAARPVPRRYTRPYRVRRPAAVPAAAIAAPATALAIAATPVQAVAAPVNLPARAGARLAPGQAMPPAELEAFVDGVVRRSMERDHIAGVTVSIVQNGQLVLKKGYGLAKLSPARPVDPDRTLFRLGSISKTFTWIALMKEVEAGRVRLDAPINLYLPEKLQIRDQGMKQPILVRDLMRHTPGFEDKAMGQLFERDPGRLRPLVTYLRQERPDRVREPGLFPTYSNYGVALGGEIATYVSGKPFETLIESEITGPLGMTNTTFREPHQARPDLPAPMPASLAARVSDGFYWNGAEFEAKPFEYVSQIAPAGSVSSSAADMARYMQMILNGGSLEGRSLYGPATATGFRTPLRAQNTSQNGWDHGFMETALPGGFRGQGHGGATLSFLSNMVTVPDLGLGVFVSTNTSTGRNLAVALPARIVEQFYASPTLKPYPGTPELAAQAKVYNGTYLSTRRAYSGLEMFVGGLIGEVTVTVTPKGKLLIADGDSTRAYVLSRRPGWLVSDNGVEEIKFDLENDRAVRFYDANGTQAFERRNLVTRGDSLALFAALTALCSVAAIVGLFTRERRDFRQTPVQGRAGLMQISTAILWLIAMVLFAIVGSEAVDVTTIFYAWPAPLVTWAASCALVASVLTAITVLMITTVWHGGRRVDSWTTARKLRFTLTTLIFTVFAVLMAIHGALEPWNS
jgi:CubicO group peptidase (beta-lactamase class C family)